MAIYNSMLNIMPYNCRYCIQGWYGMQHVSEEANINSINLIELQKEDAVKENVWSILASIDPVFVNGFGHGNDGIYTGDTTQAIFTSADCSILNSRIVYLLSCLTANELGPAIIDAGGIAYGGYNISWTWMATSLLVDPYTDWYAEGFYRSSNMFPIALIQGEVMEEARDKCIAEYNRWINIWETERASDQYAAAAIQWLIHDRDGLTVLGDLSASILSTGVAATSIIVDTEPPSEVHTGEIFAFGGRLLAKESGEPLPGRVIELKEIGTQEPIMTTTTDSGGHWGFSTSLDKGSYTLYAVFSGDGVYTPVYSRTFKVAVGITVMEVITPPKPAIDVNEVTSFGGILIARQSGAGIPGKRIVLTGGLSTITDSNGNWNFNIIFSAEGRYRIQAVFEGDADFIEAATDTYRVCVGDLAIFGNDQIGDWSTTFSRLKGTTFTAPEDGLAESITVWIQHIADIKDRCAIYKRDDLRLVGVTEERQEPVDRKFGWSTFVFENSPKLVANTKYILVAWASRIGNTSDSIAMRMTGDTEQGVAEWYAEYNDFPDPLVPNEWRDAQYSIYCEYKRKEVTGMTVVFSGSVSAQAAAGEIVTIAVTLPGGGIEKVTALTLEDKTFSTEYTNVPGNYTAKARVEADALYEAAESDMVPFTIGKEPRTITLTVAPK